jgi:hypothetical protein
MRSDKRSPAPFFLFSIPMPLVVLSVPFDHPDVHGDRRKFSRLLLMREVAVPAPSEH